MAQLISADAAGPTGGLRNAGRYRVGCQPPLTSAELISAGVRPELLALMALRWVASGAVAKCGDLYFDWGRRLPGWLAGVFDELVSTGLLALAEQQDHPGLRVSLTPAGRLRYEQLRALSLHAVPQKRGPDQGSP